MTTEERFEKMEAGIRDLIVVSRTVLTSIEQMSGSIKQVSGTMEQMSGSIKQVSGTMEQMSGSIGELREAQKQTDHMLNALVQAQIESEQKVSRLADIVEKLIRFRGPNGQRGETDPS